MSRTDVASLRRMPGRDGIETLSAFYVRQRFRPHAHEGYVLGLIARGAHSVWCRGAHRAAGPGTIVTFNPGDVHHGAAGDPAGWEQHMVYVEEAALRRLMEDMADRPIGSGAGFGEAFRHDPAAAGRFAAAHRGIHAPTGELARDVALSEVVALTLARSTPAFLPRQPDAAPEQIRRMRDYLHAHVADDVSLARLAAVGGFRERHTIALFRRHVGMPPHAYHLQLKVDAVKHMLRAGLAAADCAAAAGFADQSHMARHFRAMAGVTPGAYAAAA